MDDRYNPLVMVIVDGLGIDPARTVLTHMPFVQWVDTQTPAIYLQASGTAVGLLPAMPGNSYVGHLTIGTGQRISQPVTLLHDLITTHEWDTIPLWHTLATRAHTHTLHIVAVCSPTGTHGLTDYTIALLHTLAGKRIDISLHLIADGRDAQAQGFLSEYHKLWPAIQAYRAAGSQCTIASLSGRGYAMARAGHVPLLRAYTALFDSSYPLSPHTLEAVVARAYAKGLSDEYIPPVKWSPAGTMYANDVLFFTQLRPERLQPLQDILAHDFPHTLQTGFIAGTPHQNIESVLPYTPHDPVLLRELLARGKKILLIAESEKEAHITRYLAGDQPTLPAGIDTCIIPSHALEDIVSHPDMQTPAITQTIVRALAGRHYDVIIANFANADMVGHTGNRSACAQALSSIDASLATLYQAIQEHARGLLVITADHGNIEQAGTTEWRGHTTNPVPLWTAPARHSPTGDGGNLADIAQYVLSLLDQMAVSPTDNRSTW